MCNVGEEMVVERAGRGTTCYRVRDPRGQRLNEWVDLLYGLGRDSD